MNAAEIVKRHWCPTFKGLDSNGVFSNKRWVTLCRLFCLLLIQCAEDISISDPCYRLYDKAID